MQKKLFIALALVLIVAGGLYFYARHRAVQVVDQQMERLVSTRAYDSLEYESLDLGMTGDLKLTKVRVSKDGMELVLQEMSLSNMDYAHETPWHMDVEIRGLHFPEGLPDLSSLRSERFASLLQNVVQDDTIPLTIRYSHDYDPEQSHSITSHSSATLPRHFTLSVDGESRNLPLEAMAALNDGSIPPEQMLGTVTDMLSTLAVPHLQIALQDEGIVETWLAATAAERGMDVEQLREQLQSQVRNYYLFTPPTAQGIAMQAGSEVAAFLEGGRNLSLTVTPQHNGEISQLQPEIIAALFTQDFKKITDLLQLQIQAR